MRVTMRSQLYGIVLFCLVVRQTAETDSESTTVRWTITPELEEEETVTYSNGDTISNCSRNTLENLNSCYCSVCDDTKCTICCPSRRSVSCCYCYTCTCWNAWSAMTLTQAAMSSAVLVGVLVTIILFFRICNSDKGIDHPRSALLGADYNADRISVTSMQREITERLRDRPPRYNDITDAPPLYDTESNTTGTPEPPPVYPGLPETTERTENSVVPSCPPGDARPTFIQRPPVAHHM